MNTIERQNRGVLYLLTFISPLLGFYVGIKNLNRKGKLAIFTLFGGLYGFTINLKEGSDGATHAQNLKEFYDITISDFFQKLISIILLKPLDDSATDFYILTIYSIAGGLFQSPIVLFLIVGLVFGYFYGSAVLKVVNLEGVEKVSGIIILLIITFAIHRSYDTMQSIRSWTGMWVLFNGVFSFYQTKQKKFLALALLSTFFHFMYFIVVIPVILAFLLKSVNKYFFILIYLVSFATNVNTIAISEQASQSDLTRTKLNSYYRVNKGVAFDPVLDRIQKSESVWYLKYGKTESVFYGTIYFIFFLIAFKMLDKSVLTEVEYGLAITAILIATTANFGSFIYTFYSRTMANAATFILAVIVLLAIRGQFSLTASTARKRFFVGVGILIFFPKMVYFVSNFLIMTSFYTIVAPVTVLFADETYSIRDVIDLIL